MKSNKKLYIWIGAAVVVLIAAAVAKKQFTKEYTEVEIEKAAKGNITEIVSANGKVQPETEVIISPEVPGEIIEIAVKEGDLVEKGQLLLRINPDILRSSVDRMVASLNAAKANLANAKARLSQAEAQMINADLNFKRTTQLKKDGAVSQAQFEQDEASYKVAKAEVNAAEESVEAAKYNVKNAEAALQEANNNLMRTTIYAPQNGTVSALRVEVGERVVGTSQMTGTELMRIADLSAMEVLVDVNESDIIRVKLGDTAKIEVDAYLGRKFDGIVSQIANSAKSQSLTGDQVTNFEVKVKILPSSYQDLIDTSKKHLSPFRPGMSATVDIATSKVFDVVNVPVQAVTLRTDTTIKEGDNMRECVFVVNGDSAKMVFVETGIQDSRVIEVKSGLSAEESIVVGPYEVVSKKLEQGQLIKQKEENEHSFKK